MTNKKMINKKFRNTRHPPREGCKYCGGTGERIAKPGFPCICLYVDHDICDFAAESLAETATKLKAELSARMQNDS